MDTPRPLLYEIQSRMFSFPKLVMGGSAEPACCGTKPEPFMNVATNVNDSDKDSEWSCSPALTRNRHPRLAAASLRYKNKYLLSA